jgi:HemY protein
MSFFRTLLWWLLLAVLGALAWEQFAPDPGQVLVRWHGTTVVFMSLAVFLAGWGLLWFGLWALWTLLRLPFTAWHQLAKKQARNRLVNGLQALNEGRHARAEALLDKAAEDPENATLARLGARRAAILRGDALAAAGQLGRLAATDPLAVALENARALLEQGQPAAVIESLQAWQDKRALPPRGQLLRAQAQVALGRAQDALALLATLAADAGMSTEAAAELERDWQAAALRESAHADELHQRWTALPARQREPAGVVRAFAERAGQLGLEAEAAKALSDAIEAKWQPELVRAYGLLPAARDDQRLARAQTWLGAHPDDAALSLCLGRLLRQRQNFGPAADAIGRAIAQGGGAQAWEALGDTYTAQDNPARAQACYANALRVQRGEAARALGDRSLREQIAHEAVTEHRDEHGMPRLP